MVDVVMPQMGESLTEGTVATWLKAQGVEVERDEPILEIDTDKVTTTIEAPADGVLSEILVGEGETVGVGAVLARIEPFGGEEAPTESAAAQSADAGAEPKGHFGGAGEVRTVSFRGDGGVAPSASRAQHRSTRVADEGADGSGARSRLAGSIRPPDPDFLSPAVLRLAATEGLSTDELRSISGSGRGGRLTRGDVERWLAVRRGGQPHAASEVPPRSPPESQAPAAAGHPAVGIEAVPERYRYSPTPRDERIPMSSVRKRIADHMVWSQRISPHTVASDEMDASPLVAYLDRARGTFGDEVPVSYTTLIAYATVQVLEEFPWMNAAVVDEEVVVRPYVHLGVAVAVEGTNDLVVPVITDADQLPFSVFARRLHDVVVRARERRLELRELEGGTFTFSNVGAVGGTSGSPIINQPQVAILSTYAIRERPWVVDGEVVARPVMGLSVSSDHRLVDGLMVFSFLSRLIDRLSSIHDVVERDGAE